MKPIISRLSGHTTLFLFPLYILFRGKFRNYVLLLLGAIILVGCFRTFYQTGSTNQVDATKLEQLKASNKFFIIHFKDSILALSNVGISNQTLTGKTSPIPREHSTELNPDAEGNDKHIKKDNRNAILTEVHLYVNAEKKATISTFPAIEVPLNEIYRMDVYELDKKRTNSSTTWSVIGIAATTVVVVAVIIAASSGPDVDYTDSGEGCGCPQVYIEQKGNFDFQNGIFSGAVYSNLERTDYLPLDNITFPNSSVNLRITGHENEVQYVNFVRLIGVPHEPDARILPDRQGKLYSIKAPIAFTSAISRGRDLTGLLNKPDEINFAFDTENEKEDFSNVYLSFNNPGEKTSAKFIIRAKNSGWSALLYKEYNLLFGENYPKYREQQERTNPGRMENLVLKQGLPIRVYVERGSSWEYAGYFPLIGTEGYRDMVMEIKIPGNTAQVVRLKLETVYRFWDLDYAAIDFSEDGELQPVSIVPNYAMHNHSGDQDDELLAPDKTYSKLNKDESIDLTFMLTPEIATQQVSYFLVSGGYYHIQETFPLPSNVKRLRSFRNPGEFDRFSREKFKQMEELKRFAIGKH